MAADDVGADQLAIIRIEGMHCHKCELAIQKSLMQLPGVHEVEVDFNSGQASVLYDHKQVGVKPLMDAVTAAGYHVTGCSQLRACGRAFVMAESSTRLNELLNRPAAEQRLREYKYRFSQSIVFGLPVVALQYWGRALGPVDSERWVSLLHALLAGWVLYVNLGMLFEGALLLGQRITGDFVIALIAALLYLASLISAVHGVVASRLWYPLMFHAQVTLLAVWTGLQWLRHARIVLTNPAAGAKADEADEILRVLRDAGVAAEVRQAHGHQLTELARAAVGEGIDAVVAAGGDGTVSAVAAALVGTRVPLGILATGTLNHFAKDLNLPLTLAEAARVIAAGQTRDVDVACLNDRPFINNSSIGIYPHIVGERERQRERLGRGKWVAMLIACVSVFRRHPTIRVRIGIGNRTVLRTTPFVFVGNNRYQMNLTMLGRRERLDEGVLSLYFVNRGGRFAFFWLALRTILGRLQQSRDFETMEVTEVWIEAARRSLRVALDGEVIRLPPPLRYEIRPRALRVLAPPPIAGPPNAELNQ